MAQDTCERMSVLKKKTELLYVWEYVLLANFDVPRQGY